MPTDRPEQPPRFPDPTPGKSTADYKARVHAWLRAVPVEGSYTAEFLRAEHEYICSLAGVEPD